VTFLWDSTFTTWEMFGVRANSSMLLLSADLSTTGSVFVGFDADEQQRVLDSLPDFA